MDSKKVVHNLGNKHYFNESLGDSSLDIMAYLDALLKDNQSQNGNVLILSGFDYVNGTDISSGLTGGYVLFRSVNTGKLQISYSSDSDLSNQGPVSGDILNFVENPVQFGDNTEVTNYHANPALVDTSNEGEGFIYVDSVMDPQFRAIESEYFNVIKEVVSKQNSPQTPLFIVSDNASNNVTIGSGDVRVKNKGNYYDYDVAFDFIIPEYTGPSFIPTHFLIAKVFFVSHSLSGFDADKKVMATMSIKTSSNQYIYRGYVGFAPNSSGVLRFNIISVEIISTQTGNNNLIAGIYNTYDDGATSYGSDGDIHLRTNGLFKLNFSFSLPK